MRLKYLFFIFLLVVPFLMLNCQNNSVPAIEIVAKAGNQYLTRDELLNWMPQDIPEEQKEILSRQYIDRWVQKTVLALTAKDDGLSLTPYEKWSLESLQKEMLAQKYLNSKLPKEIIITDQEISTYYDEKKEQFIRSEDEVHLVQLFLENLDRAIAEEIRQQQSLLEVIKKNYLDTQINRIVEKNGDLGYVPVKNLRKEIARTVRNGQTGRIYGPINIEKGYYYFQMMDRQKAGSYRSLDLVQGEIRLRLVSIKREKLAEDLSEKLKNKYTVEIFPEHIQ
ncbi:MAG: peptidyl-prolyl cis-trans isomerase [Calditrichia bacterium]|nr:peptidyl-prolyl cis-trans isomerase [Calditrichia bacterium]